MSFTFRVYQTCVHRLLLVLLLAGASAGPQACPATDYEVGPGLAYAVLDKVPWETLGPGDRVLIHWQKMPYRGKWVLCRRGSGDRPIVIRGVPGPSGRLPVIDGRNAITRPELNFWNEARSVIKIGGANRPADTMPAHITIENLEVRSARPPFLFIGRNGVTEYAKNAAAIHIEKGEHITIRNCILRNCGNGLMVSPDSQTVLVEGCEIESNGIEGSIYEHNVYTEALGMTFQANRLGPLRAGCGGNNLKDRSAGLVVRYNWIEGGNRQLDLVDAEGSGTLRQSPAYRQTFVYGNVLVERDGDGNSQIVHYGGDSGDAEWYRKGTLYFYHNTVVSYRRGNTTLFRASTNEERIDCRNNIFYTSASGRHLALLDESGGAELHSNWFSRGWVSSHGVLRGTISGADSALVGQSPGFHDDAAQDYRLVAGSACADAATELHPRTRPGHLPLEQYRPHRDRQARPTRGQLDIGAFEFVPE